MIVEFLIMVVILMLMLFFEVNTYIFIMSFMLVSLVVLLSVLIFMENTFLSVTNLFYMDYLSYLFLFLTFIIFLFVLLNDFKKIYENKLLFLNFYFLYLLLVFCFFSNNVYWFYFFFESSLLPLIFLILMLGGSFDRFKASMYMFMYTLFGSFILLLILTCLNGSSYFFSLNMILKLENMFGSVWFMIFIVFLVKMPMYALHFWLPKAHVESPTSCSMLLAGILLKLGGYGFIRFFWFINTNSIKMILNLMMYFSMMSAVYVSMLCARQTDIKKLIAYSSISHMGLVLSSIFSLLKFGVSLSVTMMMSHGFCSSGLFYMSGLFYEFYKTRNLLLFKGVYFFYPLLIYFWMIFSVFNMGGPPSLGFFSEFFLVLGLMIKSYFFMLLILMYLILNVYYSLALMMRLGHGVMWKTSFSFPENNSMILLVTCHMILLLYFLFKLSILVYIY